MQKWQQWESASEADWGLAVEREAVIRPLAEQQKLCVEDVEAAVRHLRIGRSVLYNLVHRYRQRPQTSSLLPLKRGRDTYTTVLDQNRELLLDSCIREFYLRPERPNLSVEDKTGVYSLTTPSGEEHQFAGIVDVARWATATACWMKRFGDLSR
jgi:putative transposase